MRAALPFSFIRFCVCILRSFLFYSDLSQPFYYFIFLCVWMCLLLLLLLALFSLCAFFMLYSIISLQNNLLCLGGTPCVQNASTLGVSETNCINLIAFNHNFAKCFNGMTRRPKRHPLVNAMSHPICIESSFIIHHSVIVSLQHSQAPEQCGKKREEKECEKELKNEVSVSISLPPKVWAGWVWTVDCYFTLCFNVSLDSVSYNNFCNLCIVLISLVCFCSVFVFYVFFLFLPYTDRRNFFPHLLWPKCKYK